MEGLFIFFATFFLVFVIIIGAAYVAQGITYMNLARKAGVKDAWLAWVPFGVHYINVKIAKLETMYMFIPIGLAMLMGFDFDGRVSLMAAIGVLVWFIVIDGKVLEAFGKDKNLSLLHLVPGIGSIIVFVILMGTALNDSKYIHDEIESLE